MNATRKLPPRKRPKGTRVQFAPPVRGATFDTGMLIALQSRNHFAIQCLTVLRNQHATITIPATVVAEFWRGDSRRILDVGEIEPLSAQLAEVAGKLLAKAGGKNAIDATVVASAAQRGDQIFTKDEGDLATLAAHAEGVDIVRV